MRAREINDYYNQLGEGLGSDRSAAGHFGGLAQAAVDRARRSRGRQDQLRAHRPADGRRRGAAGRDAVPTGDAPA
jgi:hypothetical protein